KVSSYLLLPYFRTVSFGRDKSLPYDGVLHRRERIYALRRPYAAPIEQKRRAMPVFSLFFLGFRAVLRRLGRLGRLLRLLLRHGSFLLCWFQYAPFFTIYPSA
ncbi:MAG: hypothetical protein IJT07_02450, partial [Oscillospiraceae bacterium]|nr:hypothetical protein [Oscillospiraceae bacterium]